MFNKIKNLIIILIPLALWGSLYPFIKIGYDAFAIDGASIPDIIMFAGYRFAVCGAVVCGISCIKKEKLETPVKKSVFNIIHMGMWAIVLHYAFTYIGLSLTDSSKTALLKQLGVLLYVCFAFLFIKDEKFSVLKIAGAVLGFAGVMAINTGSGSVAFSVGDILIILASMCTVVSSVMTRKYVQGSSPFWVTGISQLAGGVILLIAAFVMGGTMLTFTWKSTLVFGYICLSSIIAYVLWNYILRTNNLSKLFVIKFAEPLFACLFGAVLLGEDIFKLQYLAAFVLISVGIILGNRKEDEHV
ncbi:MAG: EamA family transporter [Lachnospiraceae bacterium]|nr:EamA family transporter [Lachnospiraceae bacterium]